MSPKELQLTQGETGAIGASVKPTGTPVSWSSSDDAVVTVSNGMVTAVGEGSAVVTASIVVDGVTYSDTANIIVEPVQRYLRFEPENIKIPIGNSITAQAFVEPDGAVPVSWTWYSEAENPCFNLEPNGSSCVLTAVSEGEDLIWGEATLEDESLLSNYFQPIVENLKQWEEVCDLISPELWNDSNKWILQQYQDRTRMAYIAKQDFSTGGRIVLCHNPEGTSGSLYADLRPASNIIGMLDDDTYEYRLNVYCYPLRSYSSAGFGMLSISGVSGSQNCYKFDTFTWKDWLAGRKYIPLIPVNASGERLFTMQIKAIEFPNLTTESGFFMIEIKLERSRK